MGFLILFSSLLLHWLLRVLFFWYKPIYFFSRYGFREGLKKWNRHALHQALAEDQSACVSQYMLLNKLFTRNKSTFHYGDEDDTISYCTAMSFHKDPSNSPAKGLNNFLRFMDKDHDLKSINSKIIRDVEGFNRLVKAGIVEGQQLVNVQEDQLGDAWKLYVAHIKNSEREIKL